MTVTTRQCWRCQKIKPLYEFCKDKSRTLGYSHRCKACARDHMRLRKRGLLPPPKSNAVKIKERTPLTWWRRIELQRLLVEYWETGSWPNQDWAQRESITNDRS